MTGASTLDSNQGGSTLCTELRRVHRAVLSTDSWAAGRSKYYDIANAAAHIHGMIDASRWLRYIVVGIVVVGFAGLIGFLALAWRPAIAPIQPPARDSFPAALVAKGKILAGAGYCAVCHARAGGQEFVGGYGLRTPFGKIYSTNITPDPDTGIGRWSEAAFARAMHQDIARDGSHLFHLARTLALN